MKTIPSKYPYLLLTAAALIFSSLACNALQVGVVTPTLDEENNQLVSDDLESSPLPESEETEEQAAAQETQEVVQEPAALTAVAWYGHIASMPEGSQYEDVVILHPEGTGEYGLMGSTPEIEAEIRTLRDGEAAQRYVHLWGTFSCGVDDVNGCQLLVDKLGYGAMMEEEDISNWIGTIKGFNFNMGPAFGFVLNGDVPMQYGIYASQDPSLQAEIESLRDTDTLVQVSGKLLVGFPDINSTRIEVSNLQVIQEGSAAQPTLETSFDPTANYQVYVNNRYGYQFKYPEQAEVTFLGPESFPPGDLPEGLTSEEYLAELQKTYTDQLCIKIEYSLGYIYISAEPNNPENLMVDCGNNDSFSGESQPLERTISIGTATYLAQGYEFTGSGETLDQHNELLAIDLEDGSRIVFGASSRIDANYQDYLMKTELILERIIGTYQTLQ